MSPFKFKIGDKVTVTTPIRPTHHNGGETGVIVEITSELMGLVKIREDGTGRVVACHTGELAKS